MAGDLRAAQHASGGQQGRGVAAGEPGPADAVVADAALQA